MRVRRVVAEGQHLGPGGRGVRQDPHVAEAVQNDARVQHLEIVGIGLDGDNQAALTGERRRHERYAPDVGAYVDDDVTRAEPLADRAPHVGFVVVGGDDGPCELDVASLHADLVAAQVDLRRLRVRARFVRVGEASGQILQRESVGDETLVVGESVRVGRSPQNKAVRVVDVFERGVLAPSARLAAGPMVTRRH